VTRSVQAAQSTPLSRSFSPQSKTQTASRSLTSISKTSEPARPVQSALER
jgi:hypothetical protein